MFLQLLVQLRMVADIGQQRLGEAKVAVEVAGQLNSGVVFKMAIQELDDGVKSGGLLAVVQVEVLYKSPCRPLETADDVQNSFATTLCQAHLSVVDMDSLPPLLVISRLVRKQGMKLSRVLASAKSSCDPEAILHNVQGELQKGELVYALRVDQKVRLVRQVSNLQLRHTKSAAKVQVRLFQWRQRGQVGFD